MPQSRTRRAQGIGPQRMGVEGSLSAPGLHVPQAQYPGYVDAAAVVKEILQALGSVSAVVAQRREQQEYSSEKERRRVASAQKSQLALDVAGTDLAEFPHLEGNTDLQDVDGWLADHALEFEPEVVDFYRPRLLEAVIKVRKEKVREALWIGYVEEGTGIQERLASDPFVNKQDRVDLQDDFEALEKDCIDFGEKPNQFRTRVLEPAARAVAAAAMTDADVERADWLAGMLKTRGRADLAEDVRQNARLSRSKYLYQVLAEEIRGTESTKQLQSIGGRVDKLADKDLLFEGQRDQLNIKLGIRREEFHRARQRRVEEQVFGYLGNKPGGLKDRSTVVSTIRKAVHDGIFTSKEALPLLEKVGKTVKGLESRQRVLAKVSGKAIAPLTREDDKAVYQLAEEQFGPDDPQGRARFFAAAEYVPRKQVEQIARGIESGDAAIAKTAVRDFLLIRDEYRAGADAIFDGMDEKAQARTMAVMIQAEEQAVDLTDPEAAEAFLQQQASAIISIEAVELSNQDALNEIFLKELTPGAEGKAEIALDQQGNVAKAFAQASVKMQARAWLAKGWTENEYAGIETPSRETANRWIEIATDSYRALLSIGWPSKLAVERARQIASTRIADAMRPVKYNEQIIDLGGGPPTAKGLGDKLFADAEGAIEKHNWAEPRSWAKKYTPTWSAAHRGYVFINNTGGRFSGRPLVFWSDGARYPYVAHGWEKAPKMNSAAIAMELDRSSTTQPAGELPNQVAPPTRQQVGQLLQITGDPNSAEAIWGQANGDFDAAMQLARERNP